jgi:hypothetical protein
MAMTSEAGVMLKPSRRGTPCNGPPKADDDVAQRAFVEVDHPAEDDAARVEAEFVAVLEVVVHHGAEEIVGLLDRIHVADKVEVDVLGGHDLGTTAAGAAAFDAEIGAERRLAQTEHGFFAEAAERVREADGGGGLAFALRRGRHGRDENQMTIRLILSRLQFGDGNFGDVMAMRKDAFGVEAQFSGYFRDATGGQTFQDGIFVRHNGHTSGLNIACGAIA